MPVLDGESVGEGELPDALRASVALRKSGRSRRTLAELEADYIAETLEAVGGNKSEAARLLGISRKNLYEKLARNKTEMRGSEDQRS